MAVAGYLARGVRSRPATIGVDRAARAACAVMAAPQAVVVALLWRWQHPIAALVVAGLLVGQLLLMTRLLADPRRHAPWYNATGTTLYVSGMMAAAVGIGW